MLRFRELPNTEVFILHLDKFWKKILDSTAAAVKTKKYNLGRYYIEMYKLCETSFWYKSLNYVSAQVSRLKDDWLQKNESRKAPWEWTKGLKKEVRSNGCARAALL